MSHPELPETIDETADYNDLYLESMRILYGPRLEAMTPASLNTKTGTGWMLSPAAAKARHFFERSNCVVAFTWIQTGPQEYRLTLEGLHQTVTERGAILMRPDDPTPLYTFGTP